MTSPDKGSVDLNTQVILFKAPGEKYPEVNDIFKVKLVPSLQEDKIPEGHLIVRNMFISIDASNRVWISGKKSYRDPVLPGQVMVGFSIGEVVYNKSKAFKIGDVVMGVFGWEKYTLVNEKEATLVPKDYPEPHHFLGVFGISGLTAWVGLFQIGKILPTDIVVVSAAAGAVGELAVQIAKNHGCRVIGIAGGKEKCAYVKSIGAEACIDYKGENVVKRLKELSPEGIDVYFDNVGGQMLDDLLMTIRDNARVILCGAVSSYNDAPDKQYGLKNYSRLIIKKATMQGYIYYDYRKLFPEAVNFLMEQVRVGKLKFRIDMLVGLEEAPKGLQRLLQGKNTGKVIVKVKKNPYDFSSPKL